MENNNEIINKNKKHFSRQWSEYGDLNCMGDKDFTNHLLKCTNSEPKDWKDKIAFEGGAGCLDIKTEILTNKGWKNHETISYNDRVLSLDLNTNVANYYDIKNIFKYNYKGTMKLYEGKIVNFCLTPNHNFLHLPIGHDKYLLEPIENIDYLQTKVKKNFLWRGEEKKYITIEKDPNGKHKKHRRDVKYPIVPFLKLLGWYLSEGCIQYKEKTGHYKIMISQSKKKYLKDIENILTELNLNWSKDKDSYVFTDKNLFKYLKKNCYNIKEDSLKRKKSKYCCYNKEAPSFVATLSPRLIDIFLNSFCKGDGSFRKTGRRFYTTSLCLVDNIQELILKTGNYCTYSKKNVIGQWHMLRGGVVINRVNSYVIGESTTNKNYGNISFHKKKFRNMNDTLIKDINYHNIVWCVETLPYHNIYIRRNGKSMWTGNSGRNVIGALDLGVKKITVTELSDGGIIAIRKNTLAHQDKIPFLYPANLCDLDRENDNAYDIAFSINCIPHILNYKKAISELVRITKPGGLIMFNMPPMRDPLIAKNDKAIRALSTQFDEKGGKIFSKIITYMANTPEIANPLCKVMELSGDVLSAYDHFLLPYSSEFTQEEVEKVVKELKCEVVSIDNLISIKAKKL